MKCCLKYTCFSKGICTRRVPIVPIPNFEGQDSMLKSAQNVDDLQASGPLEKASNPFRMILCFIIKSYICLAVRRQIQRSNMVK